MPRGLAQHHGLRGPGQERFPESPRAQARTLALTGEATVLYRRDVGDGAGAHSYTWSPVAGLEDLPARLDSAGGSGSGGLVAEQINEETTHVIHLEPSVELTASHRLRMAGDDWLVLAIHRHTGAVTLEVEVRVA